MKSYKHIFLITVIVSSTSLLSMDIGIPAAVGVMVKTSDNKELTLPQWKI